MNQKIEKAIAASGAKVTVKKEAKTFTFTEEQMRSFIDALVADVSFDINHYQENFSVDYGVNKKYSYFLKQILK